MLNNSTEKEKFNLLIKHLKGMGSVAVAFSGGQDSSFLLYAAKQALNDNVVAFTVNSPYMAEWEINEACELTNKYAVKHFVLNLPMIDAVKLNPTNRCYLCKHSIFSRLKQETQKLGIKYLVDGTNSDDINGYRPGLKALKELDVSSPLLDNNFSKREIRELSKQLGLSTWDKPAYACLLSRIPYNHEIKMDVLERIEKSEKYLIDLGFSMVRVRVHDNLARIEIPKNDLPKLFTGNILNNITAALTQYGFEFVTIDTGGYTSGCYDTQTITKP